MNTIVYLGQKVNVIIDRPLWSKHPKHGFVYEVNYGYIPNTISPDGKLLNSQLSLIFELIRGLRHTHTP